MSKTKRNIHRTGALAAILDSGGIKPHTETSQKKEAPIKHSTNEQALEKPAGELPNLIIHSIDPNEVCNWEHHDRPQEELGELDTLAKDLKMNGQQQPCLVRKTDNSGYKYEVIAGERRWRAAKLAGIELKAVIQDLSDKDAAVCQAAENSNRKDLSDYARGLSYDRLIKNGVLTQSDLVKTLNINKVAVSRLLSFSEIPGQIIDRMADKSLISARTAAEIRSLANKGQNYIDAIIALAPKIESGKLGARKLSESVEKLLNQSDEPKDSAVAVHSKNGRHLFTWRKDSNKNLSISFPKDVRHILEQQKLEDALIYIINQHLDEHNEH